MTPESFDRRFNAFHTYRFAPYLGDSVVDSVVHELDPKYYAKSRFPFMRFAFYNSYKTFDALQGLKHYLKGKKTPISKTVILRILITFITLNPTAILLLNILSMQLIWMLPYSMIQQFIMNSTQHANDLTGIKAEKNI